MDSSCQYASVFSDLAIRYSSIIQLDEVGRIRSTGYYTFGKYSIEIQNVACSATQGQPRVADFRPKWRG